MARWQAATIRAHAARAGSMRWKWPRRMTSAARRSPERPLCGGGARAEGEASAQVLGGNFGVVERISDFHCATSSASSHQSGDHRPYSRRAVNVRCSRRSGYVLSFCQSWNQAEYAGFDLDTLLNAVLPHSHRRMPPVFWGAARRYRGRSIGGLHAVEGRRGMVVARERLAPAFLFGTPRYGNRSSPMWFSTGTLPEPRGHASSPVGVGCRFIPVRFDL